MRYTIVSTEDELLELEDVKEHLRTIPGDDSEDDAILFPMISAAREYCENLSGYAFVPQTIRAYPECNGGFENLPRVPISAIQGVWANFSDGTKEKIPETDYSCDLEDGRFLLKQKPSDLSTLNPIEVEYTAGNQQLPWLARQAMLLLIGHWYANRESVNVGNITSVEIAQTTSAILKQYRRWW